MAESISEITAPTIPSEKTRSPRQTRFNFWQLFSYGVLILGTFIAVYPFFWMLMASIMTVGEANSGKIFPKTPQWDNYAHAWREANLGEYFTNSILITLITLAGLIVFTILAAYAFARIKFFGRDLIFGVLLASMMIPEMVNIIPNFLTVTWLGRIGPIKWIDNWPSLTVPFMGSVFFIFLLRQFFAQIPDDLFDAARIDGAGHLRFLLQVVLPISKAPLMTMVILSFIGAWNALSWPLLVTNSPEWRPIAVGLSNFLDEAGAQTHWQMAGSVITMLPILGIYFLVQRQFTESIARSGLKG
jgi:ABC-type glycerol-3-phosphate transport system permease component